jgi:TolC family type I secretion outer membrane protein
MLQLSLGENMKFKMDGNHNLFIIFMLYLAGIISLILLDPKMVFSQKTERWSLMDCLDLALERNPIIKSAKEKVLEARLQKWEAYSSIFPKISTDLNYTHQEGTPASLSSLEGMIPKDMKLEDIIPEDNYTFSLSIQQPIFDQGKYFILRPQVNLGIEISELNLETSKQNILFGVISAYLTTLKADEMLIIAKESKERLAEHLRVTKRRFEVGQVAKNDVLRAEMELANAESELIHAEKGLALSYEILQKILFIENESFTIMPFSYPQQDQRSLEELTELAYEKRPDYLQVVKTKKLTEMGISLAKRDFFPMINLFCEYERSEDKFFPGNGTTTVGGSISLPIFEGGIRMVRLKRARHDYYISEYQEADMKRQIKVDVFQAFLHLEDLLSTLKAIGKQIEHAQENMRIVKLRYQEGEATNLDVLDANLLLVRAQTDLTTLNYDIIEARFAIDKAIGDLRIEKIRENLTK